MLHCHIRKILCPVDFSETSRAAMVYAIDLARRFEAELTLCHVYQAPGFTFPEGMVVAGPDVLADLAGEVDRALARWKHDAEAQGMNVVHTETAMGGTHGEIVRIAEQGGYDLIVMGTHGRTGIKHALLGSVAERVVRHAPCPVLTMREPEQSFQPAPGA